MTHIAKLGAFALLGLGLTLCPREAQGQSSRRSLATDLSEMTVTAETGIPEIPFRLVNNHLLLEVSVNGSEPIDVILDSGMPFWGLAVHPGPHLERLGLDVDPAIRVPVSGSGGSGARLTAQMAMEESLGLAGLVIDRARVIVMPQLDGVTGYHQGIIGYTLFERFAVELDYDNAVMRLHEPGTYSAPPGSHVLPITLIGRVPYATVAVTEVGGRKYPALVEVDLGASHALSLNANTPSVSPPVAGLKTIVGRGVSGIIRGEVGRIAALGLGGAELSDLVVYYPVSEHQNPRSVDALDGNLGSEVLSRFSTTFDYAGRQLVLAPNQSFGDPFRYDRSGLWLSAGSTLVVLHVIPESPAAEAGINPDDVMTHLNGKPVTGRDYGDVREALRGNGIVRLSVSRGGRILKKTMVLRDLI